METKDRKPRHLIWIGVLILILGGYLLIRQFVNIPGGILPIAVGAALLLINLFWKSKGEQISNGLTIAGSLFACLGFGILIENFGGISYIPSVAVMTLMLAVGFFIIFILGYRHFGNWPLVSAVVALALTACFILAGNPFLIIDIFRLIGKWWPLLLVLAGVLLIMTGVLPGRHVQRTAAGAAPAENAGQPETEEDRPIILPPPAETAEEPADSGKEI